MATRRATGTATPSPKSSITSTNGSTASSKKEASKSKLLKEIRERIRGAEKKYVPIDRELVPLGEEEYTVLATLVERGDGKKIEVLREALAIGLGVMLKGGEPREVVHLQQWEANGRPEADDPPEDEPTDVLNKIDGVAGALLGRVQNGANEILPPSQRRRLAQGDGDENE